MMLCYYNVDIVFYLFIVFYKLNNKIDFFCLFMLINWYERYLLRNDIGYFLYK